MDVTFTVDDNEEPSEARDHGKARHDEYLKADSYDDDIDVLGCDIETGRRNNLDLLHNLVHKVQNRPQCFHLEWLPGASPPENAVYWIIDHATGCPQRTKLSGSRPSVIDDVRLTECHCDLSGENEPESRDPKHLAYQEACLQRVKAYISRFEELSLSGAENEVTITELRGIFLNLTWSSLLKHCRLDAEVVSLCRTVFGLVKRCLVMQIKSYCGAEGRENMLRWFDVSIPFWDQLPTL